MQSLQRHGVRVQEIDGEDPCGLGTQELLPRVARATVPIESCIEWD
jgi:hypothetical protein